MSELLPCPFCGGEATILIEGKYGCYTFHHEGAHKCPAAYAHCADYATETEAVKAWNTRVERTCEMEYIDAYEYPDGEEDYLCKCSNCGRESWEPAHNLPKFCGGCGKTVKR